MIGLKFGEYSYFAHSWEVREWEIESNNYDFMAITQKYELHP